MSINKIPRVTDGLSNCTVIKFYTKKVNFIYYPAVISGLK